MKLMRILLQAGHVIQSDILWKKLIEELQLYNADEPYWFCKDPIALILQWLDEILIIDQQQWKLVQVKISFSQVR